MKFKTRRCVVQEGKLNVLIGISFGSEGKGNVANYLAVKHPDLDLCIANNSPNAGHQIKREDGTVETIKMLPTAGVICKGANILLGSGSVIDKDKLIEEINKYDVAGRLTVSAFAPVVSEECKEYERENLKYIASTFQGTGAAIGLKAMRSPSIKLVKDYPELEKWCHYHTPDIILNRVGKAGHTALAEVCQGYGLSVDSEHYPHVTSRPVNVGQAFGYLDVPPSLCGDVIGVARTYIIRVGNVEGGSSGDTFYDSKEVSWEEVSAKLNRPTIEFTSVTKRKRRVFTFSKYLFNQAVKRNGVNVLFLTFVDYLLPDELKEMTDYVTSDEFNFKEIYFVRVFGEFDKFVEKIR